MKKAKCRILVVPLEWDPDSELSRQPEFRYYEAPENCCNAVGLSALFMWDWYAPECVSRVQVWNKSRKAWVASDHDDGYSEDRCKLASLEEVRELVPEFVEHIPD